MIKLMDILTEGKWKARGKYLTAPTGEEMSIPTSPREHIVVDIRRDGQFLINKVNNKLYMSGRYDRKFKNIQDLAKFLQSQKAKYIGID